MAKPRLLFISNGHGEDLSASLIAQAWQKKYAHIPICAMPLVGEGQALRRLGIEIICPTRSLPSGGFVYMDLRQLGRDLARGLVGLTIAQLQCLRREKWLGVVAVGDILPLLFAHLTGVPYAFYLVAISAHYEGVTRLPVWAEWLMRSPRCQKIFTRDPFTCQDLQQRGFEHTQFAGNPFMDALQPLGVDLQLDPTKPLVALLSGSRLPEAGENLSLLLQVAHLLPEVQYRGAIVPSLGGQRLAEIATANGWHYQNCGAYERLYLNNSHKNNNNPEILCFNNGFADILQQAQVVVGMAGTAIEQAVGLGKPVVQLVGRGPQFTHRFAEAQTRLLGCSVQTTHTPSQTAQTVRDVLENLDYQHRCREHGLGRIGSFGASEQIAAVIYELFCSKICTKNVKK